MPSIPESRAAHIFRAGEGHLTDTAEHRKWLIDLTSNPGNLVGYDRFGHAWYSQIMDGGMQLWAIVRNDEILNGGCNGVPRSFNSLSGLSRPEKQR